MTYSVHPVAELFPLLEGEELREMAESIGRNGLVHPIVCHEGKIIDGRNRLRACEVAGVEPTFTEWTGEGDPSEWIVATNLDRRHLTASQRALIALELKRFYETQARQRELAGKAPSAAAPAVEGRASARPTPEAETGFRGKASEHAARATGVSARTIERAEQLVATASPELVNAVRAGEATVKAAIEVAKLPKAEQVAAAREKKVSETARAIRDRTKSPAPPSADSDTPLNLQEFKAAYKRAPALPKRRPVHEVQRLEQIVSTVALAERAWRWINTEWSVDERADMAFAVADANRLTPLLVEFRERLADIVARCRNDGRADDDA